MNREVELCCEQEVELSEQEVELSEQEVELSEQGGGAV